MLSMQPGSEVERAAMLHLRVRRPARPKMTALSKLRFPPPHRNPWMRSMRFRALLSLIRLKGNASLKRDASPNQDRVPMSPPGPRRQPQIVCQPLKQSYPNLITKSPLSHTSTPGPTCRMMSGPYRDTSMRPTKRKRSTLTTTTSRTSLNGVT